MFVVSLGSDIGFCVYFPLNLVSSVDSANDRFEWPVFELICCVSNGAFNSTNELFSGVCCSVWCWVRQMAVPVQSTSTTARSSSLCSTSMSSVQRSPRGSCSPRLSLRTSLWEPSCSLPRLLTRTQVMNTLVNCNDTVTIDFMFTYLHGLNLAWWHIRYSIVSSNGYVGMARYLVDCCTPVTDVVGRQRLRSATQQLMVVPRHRLSTVGRRAFAVHVPMVWNSLPDDLRAQQDYVRPENLAVL